MTIPSFLEALPLIQCSGSKYKSSFSLKIDFVSVAGYDGYLGSVGWDSHISKMNYDNGWFGYIAIILIL